MAEVRIVPRPVEVVDADNERAVRYEVLVDRGGYYEVVGVVAPAPVEMIDFD